MGMFRKLMNQAGKPEGLPGRILIRSMNPGHARLADWGMEHLVAKDPEEILDIGCGGGRNAGELLKKYPEAKVTAVDYSPLCVEQAAACNKEAVISGRCTVLQGDVSHLELEEGKYDIVTAFETIYFWPGLEACFAEVAKVLKPGGCFLVVNESDGMDALGRKFEKIIDGMKVYTGEQITEAIQSAGFREITVDHHNKRPWITVLARK